MLFLQGKLESGYIFLNFCIISPWKRLSSRMLCKGIS